ncbi:MAG TPA: LamG domain-containing protein [Chitinophagaceae bacterium]|jgi:hypothetical protein
MKTKLFLITGITMSLFVGSCQKDSGPTPQVVPSNNPFITKALNSFCAPDPKNSIDNGLVGFYPFLKNANDASGNGNNGTLMDYNALEMNTLGLPVLTDGKDGSKKSAYLFNGVSNFISLPHNPLWIGSTTDPLFNPGQKVKQFSIYLRIKPRTVGNLMTLVQFGDAHASFYSAALTINAAKNAEFEWNFIKNTASEGDVVTGKDIVRANCWTDVTLTYSNAKLSLYLNGKITGSKTTSFSEGGFLDNFHIGATAGSFPIRFLDGTIDEVRLYNRSLSDKEIKYLLDHNK